MGSTSSACRRLETACRTGENVADAVEAFRTDLREKIEQNDEQASGDMLKEAMKEAVLPHRCDSAALAVGAELLKFLAHFDHKRDRKALDAIHEMNAAFMAIPESEITSGWRNAQVNFLTSAFQAWIQGGGPIVIREECRDTDIEQEGIVYINEELCSVFLRFSKWDKKLTTGNRSHALAASAYKISHQCGTKLELVAAAVEEVQSLLKEEEKPFLIARTVYGVLAATFENPKISSQYALKLAGQLLRSDALTAGPSAISSFLHDILKILEIKALALQADREAELCKVVEVLCRVYKRSLMLLGDLNWVELVKQF
ncbi:hypothetical protein, conserved [Trypanosoma brucei gambiense DAL972]|uniref:Uncharacterized protein n=2 Tax=Trypanosoma brucei TaxID=5691 RepID=D0A399_TRYB9|nr:hypothetical protein, conserved [Trypanosoma brucei gambiense DAL972]RHW69302.1 hypothetical protein DPX39_100074100 [Trypanosoma brucei equiperdum]CBH15743.1 hypothetical protein, conserved [Trypanosoma brucei gambiense DAL972]|eukprot:XP_011778007.1 hypothetical protein, conserved [Trypanosoma brucei gambiense DAL972]